MFIFLFTLYNFLSNVFSKKKNFKSYYNIKNTNKSKKLLFLKPKRKNSQKR